MSRVASRLGGFALFWLAGRMAGAQVSGSLDLSASDLRYDLFQSSGAVALSPAFRFDRAWTSVAARGTLLRYQSGHRDLHGSLVGTTFTPAFGPFRLEVGGDLGASRYLSLPAFSHVFAAADLHYLRPGYGAWVGGTGGSTSFGGRGRGAGTWGGGIWAAVPWATLTLSASRSAIGDTGYTDVEGASHLTRGRFGFDGALGARTGSRGGGHGVYGEAALSVALTRIVSVIVGAGRYPTDPTRGTIAGRYATLTFRLGSPAPARPLDPYQAVLERYHPLPAADTPVSASIAVGPAADGGRVVRVRAEGAGRVEVMGDFTDWRPVPLRAAGDGRWETVLPIPSGPHRVQVRVDGGAWVAPLGATRIADEFGGETGLIVVP